MQYYLIKVDVAKAIVDKGAQVTELPTADNLKDIELALRMHDHVTLTNDTGIDEPFIIFLRALHLDDLLQVELLLRIGIDPNKKFEVEGEELNLYD